MIGLFSLVRKSLEEAFAIMKTPERPLRKLTSIFLVLGLAAAFSLSAVACKPSGEAAGGLKPPKAEIVPAD